MFTRKNVRLLKKDVYFCTRYRLWHAKKKRRTIFKSNTMIERIFFISLYSFYKSKEFLWKFISVLKRGDGKTLSDYLQPIILSTTNHSFRAFLRTWKTSCPKESKKGRSFHFVDENLFLRECFLKNVCHAKNQ